MKFYNRSKLVSVRLQLSDTLISKCTANKNYSNNSLLYVSTVVFSE